MNRELLEKYRNLSKRDKQIMSILTDALDEIIEEYAIVKSASTNKK